MKLTNTDILALDKRHRATFINSLAGYRQVVLIGTKSPEGDSNIAIFNSLIHIGANPPLWGFICRPDTVQRDTLRNILDTKFYTFNYINTYDVEKAHQTSAKYESGVSEFSAVGFTEEYQENYHAPFVKQAVVKIGMQFEEKIDIKLNGTMMIIGSIQSIDINERIINKDGFVALEKENVVASVGLDAYYEPNFIKRMSYAKPESFPKRL